MQAKVGQFRRPFRDNGKELPRAQQDCLIATVHAATGADASASVYIVKSWDIAILRLHKIELIYTQKLYIGDADKKLDSQRKEFIRDVHKRAGSVCFGRV